MHTVYYKKIGEMRDDFFFLPTDIEQRGVGNFCLSVLGDGLTTKKDEEGSVFEVCALWFRRYKDEDRPDLRVYTSNLLIRSHVRFRALDQSIITLDDLDAGGQFYYKNRCCIRCAYENETDPIACFLDNGEICFRANSSVLDLECEIVQRSAYSINFSASLKNG